MGLSLRIRAERFSDGIGKQSVVFAHPCAQLSAFGYLRSFAVRQFPIGGAGRGGMLLRLQGRGLHPAQSKGLGTAVPWPLGTSPVLLPGIWDWGDGAGCGCLCCPQILS